MGFLAPAMPFIAKAAPFIGSALGALGGRSGNKATSEESYKSTQDSTQTAIEDPLWKSFREGLMPIMMEELKKANEPVYGDAQKASFLNGLNDLANASVQSLKNNLAAVGGLRSGRAATGLGNIEQEKIGKASQFFSQLPFMEREAQFNRMGSLLGMATNWAGRAPVSMKSTGTSSGTSNRTMEQQGPGFWSQFATDMGGQLALGKSGAFGGLFGGGDKDGGGSAYDPMTTLKWGGF